MLVSASFDGSDWLTLAFDQGVTAGGGYDFEAFAVDDGPGGVLYAGSGAAVVVDARTLRIPMESLEPTSGADVTLTVSAANGIVGTNGDKAWPGAAGVVLPFGA